MSKEIKILVLIVIVVVVAAIVGASYYRKSVQSERKPLESGDRPLVRPDSPTIGSPNAPVTLVEFLDPECESCAAFNQVVKKILKDYDGRIRLVVRYMPFHPSSRLAASFTEAAGEQGKYWEMQELLFRRQSEWGELHGIQVPMEPRPQPRVLFERFATELGLDVARVNDAVNSNRYAAKIERDLQDGRSLGVARTPSFFVNGRPLARFSEIDLRALIDEELRK